MRNLVLSAAAMVLIAAPGLAFAAAAPHYDCTNPHNANKAQCKAEAAAAPAAPATKPAAAKAAPTTTATPASGKAPSPAQKANQDKMKACGAQWDKLSDAQKADWKTKGEKFKDKNGKPYTGWITFSIDCRKK